MATMNSGGRTTRSKRSLRSSHHEEHDDIYTQIPTKIPHLSDVTVLTPPPSQYPDDEKRTRRGRNSTKSYLDASTTTSPLFKSRSGIGNVISSTIESSASSGSSSDQSLTPFNTEDLSLDYGIDLWPTIGLSTDNDPNMYKAASRSRDLHTPTPPMSPDMLTTRPDTPTIRPETPTGSLENPLSPMDHSLVSSSLDTSSLVDSSSILGYGPPPTPMCSISTAPTIRVGIYSSSSSLCAHLSLSSSSSTTPTASLVPPVNILDSEDDDDEELSNINSIANTNNYNYNVGVDRNVTDDNDNRNSGTHKPNYYINNNRNAASPDITSEPLMLAASTRTPSPNESTLSKISHRLRIRAPPPRSCRSRIVAKECVAKTKPKPNPEPPKVVHQVQDPKSNISTDSQNSNYKKASQTTQTVPTVITTHSINTIVKKGFFKMQKNTEQNQNGEQTRRKFKLNFLNRVKLPSRKVEKVAASSSSSCGHVQGVEKPKLFQSPKRPVSSSVVIRKEVIYKNRIQKYPFSRPSTSASSPSSTFLKPLPPPPKPERERIELESGVGSLVSSTTTAKPDMRPPVRRQRKRTRSLQDGCLVAVELENFLAHKKLHFDFKTNIVFINGDNGSGKSAMFNAIQILCGYKASSTYRASNVAGFIKKGCKYGSVRGWISNYSGTLPIETYGEVIMIFRKFNISGNSFYKIGIPNEKKERILSSSELKYICETLQIYPDNPFQFLKQETGGEKNKLVNKSKTFQKNFYMLKDATQITYQEDTLQQAKEYFDETKQVVKLKKENLKFFILQEKQSGEQVDLIHKIENQKEETRKLEIELAWSEVSLKEEEREAITKRKEDTVVELEEHKKAKLKLQEDIDNFHDMSEAKKVKATLNKDMSNLLLDKEAKMNELRDTTKTLNRVQNVLGLSAKAIEGYKKKIEELTTQLNEDALNYEDQNQVYEAEILRLTEVIAEKEKEKEKLRERRDEYVEEMNQFKARESRGKANIKKLEGELNQTKKELDKNQNYSKEMREFLRRIKKETWKSMPVGPFVSYINVSEEKYAPLVEHILGHSTLNAFVVQDTEDLGKLRQLQDQVWGRKMGKPTLVSLETFSMIEYLRRLRHFEERLKGFKTVLSLLQFSDPMVKVGVIEKTNCERIVIFDTHQAACSVLKDERTVPPSLMAAYTLNMYRVSPAPRYQFQPLHGIKGNTKFIPMAKETKAIHIREEITREKEILQTCKEGLEGFKDGITYRPGIKRLIAEIDEKIHALNKEINQHTHKIKNLKEMIREGPGDSQDRDLQNQIKAEQDMLMAEERRVDVREQELNVAKAAIIRLNEEKEKIELEIKEGQEKIDKLVEQYDSSYVTHDKIRKEAEYHDAKINKLSNVYVSMCSHETSVVNALADKTKEAEALGERPSKLDRSPADVKKQLEKLRLFVNSNKQILKDKARILADHANHKALVKKISTEISDVEEVFEDFSPYLRITFFYLDNRKLDIANRLEMSFQTLCENHGLTGKLIVDWDNSMIIYFVSPDKGSDASVRQYFKKHQGQLFLADKQGMLNYWGNLSGGERRKCEVFFTMSVWDVTDLPCHFMDEFEVFMDEISRAKTQKYLIKHAKMHKDKQFVFFTPQVLVGIDDADPYITKVYLEKVN